MAGRKRTDLRNTRRVVSASLLLTGLAPFAFHSAASVAAPLVADDFNVVNAGGTGWAAGSNWGGVLTYLTSNPIDSNGLQHVRTSEYVFATREIDPTAAATLDASDDVWIAFDARRDFLQSTSQFAGISLQASGAERFFLGGPSDTVPWGGDAAGEASVPGATPAGAEWNAVMAHLDFLGGTFDIYVNGTLQASDANMPLRGWNEVRIASGGAPANRLFVDRLRIGTTRIDVEALSGPRFVAAQWSDDTVRLLDANRSDTGGFAADATDPNGIATDGVNVYTAHFSTEDMIVHDFDGNEVNRWSVASLSGAQGLELVEDEIAVVHSAGIAFLDRQTGAVLRNLSYSCPFVSPEGLAYDGTSLWISCGATLEQIDPNTAASVSSIPNASSGCTYGGTGITVSAPGELTLACTHGDWYRVAAADGSVIDSGNNGADMYGIKYVPEPGMIALLGAGIALLTGLGRRRGSALPTLGPLSRPSAPIASSFSAPIPGPIDAEGP